MFSPKIQMTNNHNTNKLIIKMWFMKKEKQYGTMMMIHLQNQKMIEMSKIKKLKICQKRMSLRMNSDMAINNYPKIKYPSNFRKIDRDFNQMKKILDKFLKKKNNQKQKKIFSK